MLSTDYSYFNFNNYPSSGSASMNVDYSMLPQYSVNGIPLLTYFLVGVTAVTLGYITLKENDIEPTVNEPFEEPEPVPEPEPEEETPKTGGKKKMKKRKTQKGKKGKNKTQ